MMNVTEQPTLNSSKSLDFAFGMHFQLFSETLHPLLIVFGLFWNYLFDQYLCFETLLLGPYLYSLNLNLLWPSSKIMKLSCDMTIKISKWSILWNRIILGVVMNQSFDISIGLTTRWPFIARIFWYMKITTFSGSMQNQSYALNSNLNESKKS